MRFVYKSIAIGSHGKPEVGVGTVPSYNSYICR